jgi:hypothetical protein
MTTKTVHRHANGTPPEPATAQSHAEDLAAWLEQRGLTLNVRVKAPVTDDTVSLENFIPAGWNVVFQVVKKP